MPIIDSTYKPSFLFKNGFVSTVYSGLVRRVKLKQERERITLKDGDFLDLDWSFSKEKTNKLILCFHGLEGHGQRPYVTGVAKLFNEKNIDAICVNFRGCSGEMNLVRRVYHSGETTDLDFVVHTILEKYDYEEVILIGFSLGGNVVLKYAGEKGKNIHPKIKKAFVGSGIRYDLLVKEYNKLLDDEGAKTYMTQLSK